MDSPKKNHRQTYAENGIDNSNGNHLSASKNEQLNDFTVINSFFHLMSTKLMNAKMDHITSDKAYSAEASIIRQVNGPGVLWGMAAGISTFAFLRRGPVILVRAMNRRKNRNTGGGNTVGTNNSTSFSSPSNNSGYQFDNVSNQNNPFQKSGNLSEATYKRSGGIFGLVGFVVDTVASLFVAANVSLVMTDTEHVRTALADLPLVEGRSVVSDELCIDSLLLFNQYPKEFWKKERDMSSPSKISEYLKTINNFVKNCEKRAAYEDEIRKERGLPPTTPVAIPSPGVPRDYVIEDVVEENGDDFNNEDEFNVDFEMSPTSQSENWNTFDSFENDTRK